MARVLVVGAGGIGGLIAARLWHAGVDVTALSKNGDIVEALNGEGYRLIDAKGRAVMLPPRTPASAATPRATAYPPVGMFDVIVVATQPPQVEAAVAEVAPHLAVSGNVVVVQNGLCEARVAAIVGATRVIGAVVAWGASMHAPGIYEQTAKGGFTLGRLDGPVDAACREVGALLAHMAPVRYTDNLLGVRWSKLALNCAISSLGTIAGQRLGTLIASRANRRLALEVMSEVVQVAVASGVRLELVAGTLNLPWLALTPREQAGARTPALAAKHALLWAVGQKYRRMRSSMLSAIERGKPPSVDFLNGEVVAAGARVGVATPKNARIVELVWRLARREVTPSPTLLGQL